MDDATSFGARARKRWRAWLRSVHRDIGYISVGFTFIYAISGIAQNHIEEWGDVSFKVEEHEVTMPAAIPATASDADAFAQVAKAVDRPVPSDTYRAGDEVRLAFPDGTKASAIGDRVIVQQRTQRFFLGVANWLHRARGKPAWKYISDVYALMLLYLSFSGLMLIKGKLGFRWRGMALLAAGVAVPVLYVTLSGGPTSSPATDSVPEVATKKSPTPTPTPTPAAAGSAEPLGDPGSATLKPLPPDDED